MRHIGSFLLALVFAPAIFLLTGTGLSAFQTMWVSGGAPSAVVDAAVATGALLLASILYAILTMVRLSPVGPFLAGLGMFVMSAWAASWPQSYAETFAMLDVHMGGAVGQSGLGLVLAVPLLATVVSPRRWRKHERLADETVALQAYPLQQGRPAVPADQTRAFTSVPGETGYTGLPDVPPPSLHYPRATPQSIPTVNVPPTPVAPPQAAPPQAAPPKAAPSKAARSKAAPVAAAPPGEAPPLPRRTPAAESAVAAAATQPAVSAQATTQPAPPAQAAPPVAQPPVAQPAVPPQRSATAPSSAAPAASQSPVPPPLPEESTVMLTPPADQQTIKLERD
ncbi:hypothetical protein [Catellatospora paridis]|uniref:hypothetical protein n=1 Tax=Catellatospora paridis TaxID=1617086 RepID=UPI0012D38FED|nr:hypothetical protein [Catellatospora paridis]